MLCPSDMHVLPLIDDKAPALPFDQRQSSMLASNFSMDGSDGQVPLTNHIFVIYIVCVELYGHWKCGRLGPPSGFRIPGTYRKLGHVGLVRVTCASVLTCDP